MSAPVTRRFALALLLAAVPWGGAARFAAAGEPLAAETDPRSALAAELGAPGRPPPAERVEAITVEVASGLRCPVCEGLSVADSDSEAALTMKDRVRSLIAEGYTEEQVQAYFVHRYGTWILRAPPARGFAWSLWVGPALLLVGGVVFVARRFGGRGSEEAGRGAESATGAPGEPPPTDPYAARFLDELEGGP